MKPLNIILLITMLYAPKVNVAQVVNVKTVSELNAALQLSTVKPITKIVVSADTILALNSPITLPSRLQTKTRFSRLIIDFQGAEIHANAPMAYVIGRAMPDSQRIADDVMQSQAFSILNCFIDCKGMAQVGILMRATYHDYIAWCTVNNAVKEGISERFGMNAYIFQCEVRSCGGNGIELRNGDWNGAAMNNSGSNMASVLHSRVFPKNNQTACFASIASGNTLISGCISDFAVNNKPQVEFLIDNTGSTTCKQNTLDRNWSESEVLIAHIKAILNGGTTDLSRFYPQKGGVMVLAQGGNYAQINYEKNGNTLGKFQGTTNNGVVWFFGNNGGSYDFAKKENWVNNLLPISFYVQRFISTQEYAFNVPASRNLKINDKILIDKDYLTKELLKYQLKP